MIVDRRIGLFILMRESLLTLALLGAWDIFVVVMFQVFHQDWMEQPTLPVSLLGSAVALFLGVRNNAAYGRWWEARTLWGAITNNCRSFGRQAGSLLGGRPDLASAMAAYPYALRAALGRLDGSADIARLLPPEMQSAIVGLNNQPNAILYQIGLAVNEEVARQKIDGAVHGQIDRILSDLANAQGGLERIRNTPLAIQFSLIPRLVANMFCVILPLSMVQTLGWITPLGSSLVGLLFVALDKIGSDLQDPFDNSPHAMPMRTMARTIEIDLLQPVHIPVEGPIAPVRGVQS
ncbi:bestrophin family protein [Gluconacetobacter sp. Hr-1-5]|uniref:bestrophin family protein n=1 Tax=Gluconacetobacter sp. Hr-1-5 TaxID=3395370 RepID=UPI003B522435